MISSAQSVFVGPYSKDLLPTLTPNNSNIYSGSPIGSIIFTDNNGKQLHNPTTKQHFKVLQIVGTDTLPDGTPIDRVRMSNLIDPEFVKNKSALAWLPGGDIDDGNNEPPLEEVWAISANTESFVVSAEERYVLRLQFKDLTYYNAGPAYYSKSYEVFGQDVPGANDAAKVQNLLLMFRNKVNADPSSRVIAAIGDSSNVLTLTAKEKDNSEGLWPLNDWTQVTFVPSIYFTSLEDSVLYNNYYETAAGITISKTQDSHRGVGYWKDVRDMERHNLSSQGYTAQTTWWVTRPTMFTNPLKSYVVASIDYEDTYKSSDNQYSKLQPKTITIASEIIFGSPSNAPVFIHDIKAVLGITNADRAIDKVPLNSLKTNSVKPTTVPTK
jgi:hypothetical protein